MLALPRARVLGEGLGQRQARRREHRRMVEEPGQKRPASVVGMRGEATLAAGQAPCSGSL